MRFNGCTNVSSASSSPDILIISPHLDDAVLSCGGLLSLANARGFDACVLTVFAGEPDPGDVGPLASWIHQLCGQGEDAVSARRVEDLAAGSLLGFDSIHLDFLDCAYRRSAGRHLYPTESSVFGSIAIEDRRLTEEVARRIGSMRAPLVLAPMAVGGHVDHIVARDAATQVFGTELLLFEDVPYAFETSLLVEATAGRAHWTIPIDGDAKRQGIECYSSQLEMLWRGDESLWEELLNLSLVNGALPCERFWTTSSDQSAGATGSSATQPMRWNVDRGPVESRFDSELT